MINKCNHLLNLLEDNPSKTCFVLNDERIIFDSEQRGVKPLMDFYNMYGVSEKPLTVVDRIMGKGAVLLAVLIGAKRLVTPIISEIALEFADKNKLEVEYGKVVPYIVNRTKDGQCPIEESISDESDVKKGFSIIVKTLQDLRSKAK